MSTSHYKLNNLIVFLDHNGLQIDGRNEDVMGIEPIGEKFKAFGWNILEIDGHDLDQIGNAVDSAKKSLDKPTLIHARTVKGKGVSFMENQYGWHGVAPKPDELEAALKELER